MKFTILIEGFIAFSKYAFSINSVLGEVKMKILKTSYALKLHVHVYDHFDRSLYSFILIQKYLIKISDKFKKKSRLANKFYL